MNDGSFRVISLAYLSLLEIYFVYGQIDRNNKIIIE